MWRDPSFVITGWARHLHDNGPSYYMTDAVTQASYHMWDGSFATGGLFIAKIHFLCYKFTSFPPYTRQCSSDLFYLPVYLALCLKFLTTIFSSKIMYINPYLALKNRQKRSLPSDFVSHKFPTHSILRYCPSDSASIRLRLRLSDFASAQSTSPVLVFAVYWLPITVTVCPLFIVISETIRVLYSNFSITPIPSI
jgi:hypothetical protein